MQRILIADDDLPFLSMAKESLTLQGYEVQVATDGADALYKAKGGSYDLVLLDIMMPHRDGYEVAAELKSSLGAKAPKVLFITCRDVRNEGHFAKLIGAAGMMQKPFTLDELSRRVKVVLTN
jgi:DNA-binding response OmpR family regulator